MLRYAHLRSHDFLCLLVHHHLEVRQDERASKVYITGIVGKANSLIPFQDLGGTQCRDACCTGSSEDRSR